MDLAQPARERVSLGTVLERVLLLLLFTPVGLGFLAWGLLILPPSGEAPGPAPQADPYLEAFCRLVEHPQDTEPAGAARLAEDPSQAVFVGQLRRSRGDARALEAFYARQAVHGCQVRLAWAENGTFSGDTEQRLPEQLDEPAEWVESSTDLEGKLYLVYVFTGGSDP